MLNRDAHKIAIEKSGLGDMIERAKKDPEDFLSQRYDEEDMVALTEASAKLQIPLSTLVDFQIQMGFKIHEMVEEQIGLWAQVHMKDRESRDLTRHLFLSMAGCSIAEQSHAVNGLLQLYAASAKGEKTLEELLKEAISNAN